MTYALQIHVERFLQIDVTAEPEAVVTQLLEHATGLVTNYTRRRLELTAPGPMYTTEIYDSPPGSALRLRNRPINESNNTVAVVEDGTALTVGDDYLLYNDAAEIIRVSSDAAPKRWIQKLQTITVTYDAGYDFTIDPLLEYEALIARDVTTRVAARAFQAAAAYAGTPAGSAGVKTLSLAGSDTVTFTEAVADVATAAVQLTDDDMAALRPLRSHLFF